MSDIHANARAASSQRTEQIRLAKPLPAEPEARKALQEEAKIYLDYYVSLLTDLDEIWNDLSSHDLPDQEASARLREDFRLQIIHERVMRKAKEGPPACHLLQEYVDLPPETEWGLGGHSDLLDASDEWLNCRKHNGMRSTIEQTMRVRELYRRLIKLPGEGEGDLKIDVKNECATIRGVHYKLDFDVVRFLDVLAKSSPGSIVSFPDIKKQYPELEASNQSRIRKKIDSQFPGLIESFKKQGYRLVVDQSGGA